MLQALNTLFSYTKHTTQLTDEEVCVLKLKVKELHLWRRRGIHATPNFHILEYHTVAPMEKLGVLELYSEEVIERTHHDADVLQGGVNNNYFKAAQGFVERGRTMGQSPEVNGVNKKCGRNRKKNFGVATKVRSEFKLMDKAIVKCEAYS